MKKRVPNLLTPDQLQVFHAYMVKWQEILGLNDWRVEYSPRKTKNLADVAVTYDARLAAYRLGDWGAAEITDKNIEATALHELLHVLLAEVVNQKEYALEGEVLMAAEHRVVNVLEKLLMKYERAAA